MLFKTLTLDNIRSYDDETIHFDDGSNILYGKTGAGKSSILQGLFGGLFQTAVRSHVGSDFTLDNLVRVGEDEGRIELTFERGGHEYTIEWILTVTEDDDGERSAKTKPGYPVLKSDALVEPETGVRNVQHTITKDILGMDAESFVNSVYVQQGDITRLIHANSSDRREILDGLLGLSRLDELIERMDMVRLECKRARDDAKNLLDDSRNRLDGMEDEDDVQARVEELNTKLEDKQTQLNELDEKIRRLKDARSEKKDKLDSISDLRDELSRLEDDLKDKKTELVSHKQEVEDEKEAKREAEAAKQETREELDAATDDDALSHISSNLNDRDVAESELAATREKAHDAHNTLTQWKKGKLQTIQTGLRRLNNDLEEAKSNLSTLRTNRKLAEDKLEAAQNDKREAEQRVNDVKANLDEKRDAIADAAAALDLPREASLDDLLDTHIPEKRKTISDEKTVVSNKIGRLETLEDQITTLQEEKACPVCKASEDAHDINADAVAKEHAEKLAAKRERLADLNEMQSELSDLESDVDDALTLRDDTLANARDAIADAEDEIKDAEDDIAGFEQDIKNKRAEIEKFEAEAEAKKNERADVRQEIKAAKQYKALMESAESELEDVVKAHENIVKHDREVDRHMQNIDHAHDMRRQAQRQVDTLESKISDKEGELEDCDPEELESQLERIEERLEECNAERESVSDDVESLRNNLADAQTDLKNIQKEKQRCENYEQQRNWAEERRSEAEEVKEAYRDVRATLRERNLKLLRKYTNEVFDSIYQYESYRGVHIDEEYDISLLAADGEQLKPELSSGGEGTILNLALRMGIYRIIVEREGVAGAALPPLILDEPSASLDPYLVGELQNMIDTVSDWNVPQILFIDHDRHLIENADTAFKVQKDKKTKTSTVIRDSYPGSGEDGDGTPTVTSEAQDGGDR